MSTQKDTKSSQSFTSEYVQNNIVSTIDKLNKKKIDPKEANAIKELLNSGIRLEKLRLDYAKFLGGLPAANMFALTRPEPDDEDGGSDG